MKVDCQPNSEHVSINGNAEKVLVIGLGNPILGDDGVGWRVAEIVQASLEHHPGVEVECLSVGGLSLMERMLGYGRVVLIDAMETGTVAEGHVSTFGLSELRQADAGHSGSAHDASLLTALQTARAMGALVPRRVDIVAIETLQCHDFTEHLSPPAQAAVPTAAQQVFSLLSSSPS